jgi:magnesium chelatase subunit D
MRRVLYPFSAIVEQQALKTALLLNAVDPSIGGVLIQGHKGTGKSTAARALAQLLPNIEVLQNCPFNSDPRNPVNLRQLEFTGRQKSSRRVVLRPMPFVELPLNATEDRLVGSLHIEQALQTGKRRFEPGLLAAANRGILYVDEVNLLPDHLVDMLLDSAASGVNIVEREGISIIHPARFILIGTMNPEEGELRPQFLDRFGLCVTIRSVVDLGSRKSIVQRHLEFETNPEIFLAKWTPAERAISDQIVYARKHIASIGIADSLMKTIVRLTRELELQGHRADITIFKAARAHAALTEKSGIDRLDIFEAAQLVIPHRMKSLLLDRPEALRERIHDALHKVLELEPNGNESGRESVALDLEDMAESMQVPGSAAAGSVLFSFLGQKHAAVVFEPDRGMAAAEINVEDLLANRGQGKRRAKAETSSQSGRYFRADHIRSGERDYSIAVDATLRKAALRSAQEGIVPDAGIPIKADDLQKKCRIQPCVNLIVFVVDASGSMGSGSRTPMKAAKGAALSILRKERQNRSEVALIAFGGQTATLVLPPTSSLAIAESALERLPSGGATPFADSLWQAWQLIRSERLKNARIRPILVIISDGEANVPFSDGAEPMEELESLAEKISRDRIPAVFIDAAAQNNGESEMQRVAKKMQASLLTISELSASSLLQAVLNQGKLQ